MFIQKNINLLCAISFAIMLRTIISLHSFSGENKPPMYGDYEAQRHWQEISINLPIKEWYKNSSKNDLLYWGLDYPPLTAYHSLAIGYVGKNINESYVALKDSRGFESESHKNFMRNSVLLCDLIIYFPALIVYFYTIKHILSERDFSDSLFLALIYPGQILIDNGHFQYNNVSLGFAIFAICCILKNYNALAALFFSLALNYKQMELYHALPFFIYLLRECFPSFKRSFLVSIKDLFIIAVTVIATFVVLWLPWLWSYNDFMSVVTRIFPVNRGLYEDKVANFWCAFNTIIKIKQLVSNERMVVICLVSTLLAALPSCIHLFLNPKKINFLYALVNTSLAFFLFSYQVHEKSILLAAIPVMLLLPFEQFMSYWFLQVATFSMFPLFAKDNLLIAFTAMSALFYLVYSYVTGTENMDKDSYLYKRNIIYNFSNSLYIILFLLESYISPPASLPHIFILAISVLSFVHLGLFFCYFNYKQMKENKEIVF